MDADSKPKTPSLHFGPLTLELREGDVLTAPAEALCCPVDDMCATKDGLFGVMTQSGIITGDFMQGKKRLLLGTTIVTPTRGIPVPRAILIPIFNQQYGTVDRVLVQKGLVLALQEADKLGVKTLATPLFGYVKSHVDYDIICGVTIKAARQFSQMNPQSLTTFLLFAFTTAAYKTCQNQFFVYSQSE
jgi:hypothetical protein